MINHAATVLALLLSIGLAAAKPPQSHVAVPVEDIDRLRAWNEKYPPGRLYDYGVAITMEKQLQEAIAPLLQAAQEERK
jgi:hypothetical protein